MQYVLKKSVSFLHEGLLWKIKELTHLADFNTKSIVFQNITVKIYYKSKNNTSFLYTSLKSRKTYNCKKNALLYWDCKKIGVVITEYCLSWQTRKAEVRKKIAKIWCGFWPTSPHFRVMEAKILFKNAIKSTKSMQKITFSSVCLCPIRHFFRWFGSGLFLCITC